MTGDGKGEGEGEGEVRVNGEGAGRGVRKTEWKLRRGDLRGVSEGSLTALD